MHVCEWSCQLNPVRSIGLQATVHSCSLIGLPLGLVFVLFILELVHRPGVLETSTHLSECCVHVCFYPAPIDQATKYVRGCRRVVMGVGRV